mgnify:CR=1 FL=1
MTASIISAAAMVIVAIIEAVAARDRKRDKQERAQMLELIKGNWASVALGEATAKAVQRIPDAHCNGDMHAALNYASQVKHEQKEFLTKRGIHAILGGDEAA